ncbi:hypothetical protein acdb102_06050 [Acidothermaceae bacterium B102]|nr:hypothetical protein acdb102_06050 [Acidothermaceae bacterium B102]
MTAFALACAAGALVVALMVMAARDLFRQTAVERWTPVDDLAVLRACQDDSRR